MTTKELIEKLQKLPEATELYSSIDDEGNGFRKVTTVSIGYLFPDDRNNYQEVENIYHEEWTAGDCELDEEYYKALRVPENMLVVIE